MAQNSSKGFNTKSFKAIIITLILALLGFITPSTATLEAGIEKVVGANISSEKFSRETNFRSSKFDRLIGTWDLHIVESTSVSYDKIMVIVSTLATDINEATIVFDLYDSTGLIRYVYDQKARMIGNHLIFSEVKLNGNYTHIIKLDKKAIRGEGQIIADVVFDCDSDFVSTGESVMCTVLPEDEYISRLMYASMVKRRI